MDQLWPRYGPSEPAARLAEYAGFVLAGTFVDKNFSRLQLIAAFHPFLEVMQMQSMQGKPILGISDAAQILIETGLVPGLENNQVGMALTDNKRVIQGKIVGAGFCDTSVNIKLSEGYQFNAFTRHLTPQEIFQVPTAHAQGCFVIPPALLMEIQMQGLSVFQYCDTQGRVIDEFPVNPNGSVHNIAAVSNKAGNVMAVIPNITQSFAGTKIFASMRDYIAAAYIPRVKPLQYHRPPFKMLSYEKPVLHKEIWVDLLTAEDPETAAVQNVLKEWGIRANIKRAIHWEIACEPAVLEKLKPAEFCVIQLKKK